MLGITRVQVHCVEGPNAPTKTMIFPNFPRHKQGAEKEVESNFDKNNNDWINNTTMDLFHLGIFIINGWVCMSWML